MKQIAFILLSLIVFSSCKPEQPVDQDQVDRGAILTHWADQIIVPGYEQFVSVAGQMTAATDAFVASPDLLTLTAARVAVVNAWEEWQTVSMFEVGPAAMTRLRNQLNIYPVDTDGLLENITDGGYNLALPSQIDRQGFPALDYLLFGIGSTDEEILQAFVSGPQRLAYQAYLQNVANRILLLSSTVLEEWKNGYRDEYVANDGSSATASLDVTLNAFMFYYEKHLRAGKLGIPAGVFSGSILTGHIEARYQGTLSVDLAEAALDACIDFFNGVSVKGGFQGPGMKSYLDELDARRGDELLSQAIHNQFDSGKIALQGLDDDLAADLTNNLPKVLGAYDELQKNVVLLKIDMMQALNVSISYVDADGD